MKEKSERWMRGMLWAAAIYNFAWGAFIVLFPNAPFKWAGMPPPNYPQIWQCLGMMVGAYGVGYAIAATNPIRWWPLVFVGLIGKIFGPIGFAYYAWRGDLPWAAGWTIVTNDLIWWVPFTLILLRAIRKDAP
ncbi:MAG: alkyl hydroperoxide reductase [bacterium]